MTQPIGLKPGSTLKEGKFRIEKILGRGSFGITYLATTKIQTKGNLGKMEIDVKVAIKEFFMREVNARNGDGSSVDGSTGDIFTNYLYKFKKEAQNLSKLSHPNIVRVLDVFEENNTAYYAMEYIEGQNLDDYVDDRGHLTETEAINVVKEIGKAVGYLHSKKMLHLDIKPGNMMRKNDGSYVLIDFGMSKQFTEGGEPESSTTMGRGSVGYAPIELSEYKQDGTFPASIDVYALGASMFKMLTGKRPPDATYILNEGFPLDVINLLELKQSTVRALEKAMSPIRKKRFQTIEDFLNAIDTDENSNKDRVKDNDYIQNDKKENQ